MLAYGYGGRRPAGGSPHSPGGGTLVASVVTPSTAPRRVFRERDGTGVVYGKNLFCQESRAEHVGTCGLRGL